MLCEKFLIKHLTLFVSQQCKLKSAHYWFKVQGSWKTSECHQLGLVIKRCLSTAPSPVPEYRVVFIGNDTFSLPTLIALTQFLSPDKVSVVVSNLDNVVSKWAKKNSSKVYLWKQFKTAEFEEELRAAGDIFDIGVVASFGYLIPAKVINRFPLGVLNVHASLLPRWRGASPINHSIIYGDTETGISIMKIAPHRFDVGPVLLKKTIPLDPDIRAPDLQKILARLGAAALIEAIKDLPKYFQKPMHQDDSLATHAPKLTPEMAEVDWTTLASIEVYRLFRGLYGTFKLRTTFNERRVDLDDILPVITNNVDSELRRTEEVYLKDFPVDGPPGQVCFIKGHIYVRCAKSSGVATWIRVNKLKIGMKWMTAKDFRNGFLSKGKYEGAVPRFYRSKSVIEDKHIILRSSS